MFGLLNSRVDSAVQYQVATVCRESEREQAGSPVLRVVLARWNRGYTISSSGQAQSKRTRCLEVKPEAAPGPVARGYTLRSAPAGNRCHTGCWDRFQPGPGRRHPTGACPGRTWESGRQAGYPRCSPVACSRPAACPPLQPVTAAACLGEFRHPGQSVADLVGEVGALGLVAGATDGHGDVLDRFSRPPGLRTLRM